jgi:hypothetical protein
LQKLDKRPVEVLDLIEQMYEVEKQAREKGLGPPPIAWQSVRS